MTDVSQVYILDTRWLSEIYYLRNRRLINDNVSTRQMWFDKRRKIYFFDARND
jgi:hypothetical protein